jgi:Undecaprenyl-phosphate galactose phosphotransferase WbaP
MLTEGTGAIDDALIVTAPAPAAQSVRRGHPMARTRRHRVTDPELVHAVRRANTPLKRVFDIFAAVGGLIFLAPLLAPVAIAIKLNDGGPILFGHKRTGRHGRRFKCLKFRTMMLDGDEVLRKYLANNPQEAANWRESQKLDNDPRVTTVGKFLRATSIDELPQLINVLRGEMSIVGPRPVPKAELDERYAKDRCYYLLVRPGITGLWQVSGRSNTTYARRVELDRDYVRNWTFKKDVEIILKTIPAVLKSEGAR